MVSVFENEEINNVEEYDPRFVNKILNGDQDKGAGKGIKVDIHDLLDDLFIN